MASSSLLYACVSAGDNTFNCSYASIWENSVSVSSWMVRNRLSILCLLSFRVFCSCSCASLCFRAAASAAVSAVASRYMVYTSAAAATPTIAYGFASIVVFNTFWIATSLCVAAKRMPCHAVRLFSAAPKAKVTVSLDFSTADNVITTALYVP